MSEFETPWAMAGVDGTGYHLVCPECGAKCRAPAASEDEITKGAADVYDEHYEREHVLRRAIDHPWRAVRRIVRILAEHDAPLLDGTYANGHDWCTLCSGEGPRPEDHDEDCPWRLAREYVQATS